MISFQQLLFSAAVTAAASAAAGTGPQARNPILPDFHADPSAREWDGRMWIYPSHDLPGSTGWDMVDWHCFSSKDLVHWTDHGIIFSLKDVSWADKWAWAPDCVRRNGRYFFYFPADDQIGVAVADRPEGPFRDALGRPLISRGESGTRVMDPAVFIDDDGGAYLYFGQNEARVVRLKDDMVSFDGPVLPLAVRDFHEGLWMHKRKGVYYLSYCSLRGDGELKNRMEYATSNSPLGPFVHRGLIIDNRSRNVHGSIAPFQGEWVLFYHVQGPSWYERRVCMEKIRFRKDGTIREVRITK
ncbi:family 43 glycosylhydrolase [bacterium]|nr:family 43 glycosylhydrolase [bacterium]